MDCVLGLDIGTTSTIGILITPSHKVLAQCTRKVDFFAKHQGWAEENPSQWWQNCVDIIPELIATANIKASDIKAIGVTGMLPALVLLGSNNQVLRPSIQQSDGRSQEQVEAMMAEINSHEFLMKTGNGVNQQLIATKLRWIEQHEPEVFAKINTVFGSYDFINWKLTGVKAVEQNWALEAGIIELSSSKIADDLIKLCHVAPDVIPKLSASHEIMGHISEEAAIITGLIQGTPVVGGAADHIASGYAAGIRKPGDVLLKFGGSADILITTDKAKPDARMFMDYHLIPGLFMPNGCMATGGSALNWFVDKIAYGEKPAAKQAGLTIHQHLDILSQDIEPGSDGVQIVPYFLGEKTPIHDPSARGIIHGLSLNHDLRHMWRALLEGFAYAIRHHIEVFNEMGYETINHIASDGGSQSKLWMQICADVIQKPVQLLKGHPGSCLGVAWIAMIGSGLSSNWDGVANFVTYSEKIMPNPKNAPLYDKGYAQFRQSYSAIAKVKKA